jgi:hypothetical protein
MPNVGPEQILATELKQKERQEAQLAWDWQWMRDHRHAPPGSRGRRTSIYGGTCLRVAPQPSSRLAFLYLDTVFAGVRFSIYISLLSALGLAYLILVALC